ncbi:MAG: 3-oxoacyl-ACP reductase FabG [Moraxellaceae bacterium]|nr:MAG: 3-oxoacyl-ACP reductase FabG [Moraxellaceae bacterium]
MDKKIALVTGATRGIGAAIASRLVQDGFFVIGTATQADGATRITQALGQDGIGMVLDVRDSDAIDQTLSQIEQQFGSVAILVNNAGITRDNLLLRMSQEDWSDILAVHLSAVFQLSKRVLRGMTKARFGRIINISSVVAQMGNAGQANYAAAKAGIEGFSRSLAREMGSRNITVNCVAPGFIATDMTDKLNPQAQEKLLAQIAVNRLGTPDDIAHAVAFLASDNSGYITGMVLPVNGGLYLH